MIIASVVGSINLSDSVSTTNVLQKVLAGLTFNGTTFSESQSLSIGTASTSITLPISTCNFVYVKNLHLTNTCGVTWVTPVGGSNFVATLEPGSVIILVESAVGAGITGLSAQASAAATPIELVLAG